MSNPRIPSKTVSISGMKTGFVIGNYRVERRLGSGGQGEVFLAKDIVLGRFVAIKLFRSDEKGSLGLAEARLLSTVEHPNIVRIYHAERQDLAWYLVMEYLQGGDIEEKVSLHGAVSQTSSLRIMLGISKALHYAHQKGIIHRDIKPKNLLLTDTGAVKLADFGLAVKAVGLDGKAQPAGTPLYCAPELWRDEPATVQSDIYSLGATIYFLLTKQPPFSAPTIEALRESHLHQLPSRPPKVQDPLWELLLKALSKKPEDRFKTAEDFYQATASTLETLLVVRNEGVSSGVRESVWLSGNVKKVAEDAIMQLPELLSTRGELLRGLQQRQPVLLLRGAQSELREKIIEALLQQSGKTFSLAAQCVLGGSSPELLTHFAAQFRVPLSTSGDLAGELVRGLAPKGQSLPLLYAVLVQRELRFPEVAELCKVAQLAARHQVMFLLHGPTELLTSVLDCAHALDADDLFCVAQLPAMTYELYQKMAQRWTWEASQQRLRWTEDALLLFVDALKSGSSLFTLLHNASLIAKALDSRLITTWCLLAAKEQPSPLQQVEDIPARWRTKPLLWPDQKTIESLQRIRTSLLET